MAIVLVGSAPAGFSRTTGVESTVFNSYQVKGAKDGMVNAGGSRLKKKIKNTEKRQ